MAGFVPSGAGKLNPTPHKALRHRNGTPMSRLKEPALKNQYFLDQCVSNLTQIVQ